MIDDVLIYALFPQVGLKFLENRDDPSAFEPPPSTETSSELQPSAAQNTQSEGAVYSVRVNGKVFTVEVAENGKLRSVASVSASTSMLLDSGEAVPAALAGNVFKVLVKTGDTVEAGQTILVLEAMKMETDISAPRAGTIASVHVDEGDAVNVGDPLVSLA
ncbi:MAG: biotin/lipoyl-binding protein [Gammaproteobacteria bacterium]|nr:biotin/lipoyl-binding protein [Gammaproteobacteria bacterium]